MVRNKTSRRNILKSIGSTTVVGSVAFTGTAAAHDCFDNRTSSEDSSYYLGRDYDVEVKGNLTTWECQQLFPPETNITASADGIVETHAVDVDTDEAESIELEVSLTFHGDQVEFEGKKSPQYDYTGETVSKTVSSDDVAQEDAGFSRIKATVSGYDYTQLDVVGTVRKNGRVRTVDETIRHGKF